MFFAQLRNEMLKLFARKRTYIGFTAFLSVESAILILLNLPRTRSAFRSYVEGSGYPFAEYYSGLTIGVLMVVFTFLLLGGLYLALVGGDVVAKEAEDGTMRMILARPISRLRLLWLKWLACSIYTFVLIFFIGGTALLMGVIYRGGLGKLLVIAPHEQIFAMFDTAEGLWRYVRAIFFLGLAMQTVTTIAFTFSSFNMKPAAATIVTLSVFFVDFVLRNIEFFRSLQKYFITYHTACWVRTFIPQVPWLSIGESLLYLAALNTGFWIVGAMRFCTRDFKSG